MNARPENEFPTIADLRDCLVALVDAGLGEHPVQVVIVPATTLLAIARSTGAPESDKPPLMIEFPGSAAERMPCCIVSMHYLEGSRPLAVNQ